MGSIGLKPGDIRSREDIKRDWGGGIQGGIIPSDTTPNVFIYSDPAEAARYGYHWDGPSKDMNGAPLFLYTGTGNYGDQVITGRNGSVLHHKEQGRSLHLFLFHSDRPQGGKLHTYVGEYEVDSILPYVREDGLDRAHEQRSAVVFRLRPVGPVLLDTPDEHSAEDVSAGESRLVPVENVNVTGFDRDPTQGGTAQRREAELSDRYLKYLVGLGHDVKNCVVRPPGVLRDLRTDLFDVTANELYEAKGTATRNAVRLAIGQLFDYRRLIKSKDATLAVLLPERPAEDLIALLRSCNITCVYESGRGNFVRE
ncbi:hypothetical protein [Micromonospora eburnea]|uniref:ScoMcrA-like SRA domain-containing protein n=1 Tax=Micromonospora eburnea TaxID=227316 RepID=A0A1C6VNJ9_9ACTN|nr:hypothetical protein [Micromonospora eburnea]SCL67881.1 hypothetical protein GA0070604_6128 [Micromonospora eburnea]